MGGFAQYLVSFGPGDRTRKSVRLAVMHSTLLKRLATLVALLTLAATLGTTAVAAQETRPGRDAALAGDQTPELQIQRLYGAVFDRDPDAGGFAFWVNELTSGARSLSQIADAMVGISPEFTDTYGNLDNAGFVNQLYLNVQDRPGEAGGVAFWTGRLDSGALTRGGVVLGFSESQEYREATGSADPLDRLYCAFFLRNPDAGGKRFWTDRYLVDELTLGEIAQQFTGVGEFSDTYGALTDRQFVELIYKNVLGRDLPLTEVGGPNFWTGQLSTGARTRGEVMVEFSESPEYQARWTRNAPCPTAGKARPTAVADSGTVLNVGSVDINWVQNDIVPAGTTVAITSQGSRGTATDNGDGTFTYTRNGTPGTSDSFQYTLTSADSVTSSATITVTILPPGADGIPTAVADFAVTSAGTPVSIPWASNDTTDASVTVTNISTPANGAVVNNGNNTFTYTPNPGFENSTDSFTYTLSDDGDPADTSTATVTVRVTGADSGAAVADRAIVVANTAQELAPLGNDTGTGLAIASFTQPSHGVVTAVQETGTTTLLYTPDPGYTASRTSSGLVGDSFSYTLTDSGGNTSTASVEVVVLAGPECEVFMNYPYQPDGGSVDAGNIELFFSSFGCFELYPLTSNRQVLWNNVTIDGTPVTTTSPNPANVLRDLAPVGGAAADFSVQVAGTAVLTVDGATAVTIQFQLRFFSVDNGATWARDVSTFRGRGAGDVTVSINPLAS
jgi:hypothetical protein